MRRTQFEFLTDKTSNEKQACAEICSYIYTIWILTDKTSNEKQPLCRNSFLYFISTLLTICYRTFGFTLDIQIKVC